MCTLCTVVYTNVHQPSILVCVCAWNVVLDPYRGDLDISVDVEPVVLAGQHNTAVIHQGHVKTLRMLHL